MRKKHLFSFVSPFCTSLSMFQKALPPALYNLQSESVLTLLNHISYTHCLHIKVTLRIRSIWTNYAPYFVCYFVFLAHVQHLLLSPRWSPCNAQIYNDTPFRFIFCFVYFAVVVIFVLVVLPMLVYSKFPRASKTAVTLLVPEVCIFFLFHSTKLNWYERLRKTVFLYSPLESWRPSWTQSFPWIRYSLLTRRWSPTKILEK